MNIKAGNQTLKIPLFVTERQTTNKLLISSVVAINLDVTRGDDDFSLKQEGLDRTNAIAGNVYD